MLASVLIIHQHFLPLEAASSIRYPSLIEELATRHVNVKVVTICQDKHCPFRVTHQNDTDKNSIRYIHLPYSQSMGGARRIATFLSFALVATLIALASRHKIILCTSTPLTVGIPGIISKRWRGTRFIFEARDSWPEIPIALGFISSWPLRFLSEWLEKRIYRSADGLVALSPGTAARMKSISPRTRVVQIPNMSEAKIQPKKSSTQTFHKILDSSDRNDPPFTFVYFGSIGLVNELNYLIELSSEIQRRGSKIRFLVAGEGSQLASLQKISSEKGLNDHAITWLGRVPRAELTEIAQGAVGGLALVAESRALEDNCSNKVFHYFSLGLPVFFNYEGWLPSLVENEKAGAILPRSNLCAGAEMLETFASSSQIVEGSRRASLQLAKRFDSKKLAKQLADFTLRSDD